MTILNKAVLSIGSNKPDRMHYMTETLTWLAGKFTGVHWSEIYEMPALNGRDMPYLNTVAYAETDMTIDQFKSEMKNRENMCGRTPMSKQIGSIPIDIDIILWNDNIERPREFTREYFTKGYYQLFPTELESRPAADR